MGCEGKEEGMVLHGFGKLGKEPFFTAHNLQHLQTSSPSVLLDRS